MGCRHSSIPLKDLQPGSRVQTRLRKKDCTRARGCVCVCECLCVSGRCDGQVIARWDKGRNRLFSTNRACILDTCIRVPPRSCAHFCVSGSAAAWR